MKKETSFLVHSQLRALMLFFVVLLASVVHATNYINDVYVYSSDNDYEGSTITVNNNRNYYVVRDGSTNIDMNEDAGGKYIFVAYSYTDNPENAITGLVVYKGSSTEKCPASLSYGGKTYYPVSCNNDNANLNRGVKSSAPNLYLFYTKEGNTQSGAKVLTGLSGQYDGDKKDSFVQFHNGEVADMNAGAGGKYVYLIPSYSTVTRKNPSFSTSAITCTLVDAPVLPTLNRDGHTGTVTYSSDNPSVAKVNSSNGAITIGNTLGKAIITASFPNADNLFAASCSYSITTVRKDASISFSQTSYSLNALSSIENAVNVVSNGTVTYISDNPNVVTIDSKGKITAVGAGTTKVHASTPQTNEYNAAEASVEVTVSTIASNLAFGNSSYSLEVNTKVKTSYTSLDTKTIPTYESSNPSVATIDANGEITAVGLGKATITISQAATNVYSASSTSVTVYVCKYLCFTAEETNSTISLGVGGLGDVQTSTDGSKWSAYTRGTEITLKDVGDKIYFKGNYRGTSASYSSFNMTGKIAASGNVMTLTDGDNPSTSLKNKNYAFLNLFDGCTALASAPKLPATTLANSCYMNMFSGCTALTSAPELPATTLADFCYEKMFNGCTALTSAPKLPATTLADDCYYSMFEGCTALTSAPELPATTLANNCYDSMFDGCTALTSAPELPATTLADHCYYFMFSDCTALTSAPELPATTLTSSCYYGMFEGCTALTSAPALPATTLASNCYYSMFDGCTSLTSAPELPATTLANNCYNSMFNGCTALTSAPALPATTLADFCYDGMFSGCTKLNSIKVAFTDWNSATYATQYWVEYVSSTGTFICPAKLAKEFGRSHIPEGWTVQELPDYLCFTAEKANSTISFEDYGGSGNVQKSTDGFTWSDYTRGTAITLKDVGDKVYFKGNYRGTSYENYSIFTMTGKIAASGNIMTLTDGDNPTTSLKGKSFVFYDLFHYCTALTSAPELPATTLADHCYDDMFSYCTSLKSAPELPATTLASYCYYDMFQGCSALTSAPELPATTLADYCYYYMFNGCTALTSAPKLPATELANYCYLGMFEKCTALTSAPSLPATTLADNCYASMFWDCTALTSAPALPATTLADYCYERMFSGCTKLNYIKVAFTNWDAATDATRYWVEGVSSTGTFDCPVELKKQYGTSYIPRGWYRQLDGSGTSNDPYKITSADDLIGLSGHNELWDKYFIQTNDIDFGFSSDAKSYFMPIGTSEKPFTGHYDGQQHIISNLTVNHPELSSAGLFGYIGKGATVKNLMVQGIVQGKTYAGIIAGVNEGELTAIAALGTVQHTAGETSCLGGMIGKNAGGIHSSYAVVDIIHGDDDTCGGLVGQNEDGTYDNCYYDKQICPLSENWGTGLTTAEMTADGFAQKTLGSSFMFMPIHYPMFDTNDELEQFATLAITLHSDENVIDNIHQVTHDFNVTPMGYCYWHGDNDNISIDEVGKVKLIKNGTITLYADFGDDGNIIARKTIKLQIAAKPKIEKLTQTVFKHGDILTTPAITLYEEIDNAEGGWEISFTGENEDYHALENNKLLEEHNGCYLRFWAKNSIGTSYSNVICITVTSSYTLPCSYRFSTFSSNLATDFSGSGLTPYYVSDKNEARTSVTLKPFENGIVPAGQGAVLYNANIIDGTSENFTVKVTAAAGTTPAVNYLKPALTAIDFPSASSAKEAGYKYMLGDGNKWWWINGGTLAAGKAYLDLSSKPSAAKSFIMSFDEETTAISSSSNEKLGIRNSADAYNLAGQRVSKDYKGIVIKNGKKFKN